MGTGQPGGILGDPQVDDDPAGREKRAADAAVAWLLSRTPPRRGRLGLDVLAEMCGDLDLAAAYVAELAGGAGPVPHGRDGSGPAQPPAG